MFAMELVETAWPAATHALHTLASVTAAEPPSEGNINTEGIVGFFASNIAPILLAVLGVIFIGRASKGEVSKVLTSSAIALLGLAFIAGAATLFFVGESLINLIFE
ncbi:hypothetical protein GCM10022225_19590 [Plantactinospora mayteni]|uniref:Uncharacterized protein n=1 Tax=Plantactinospora mayteni TaxID=566021 RepID=A0ABQ4EN89_9ACTN|nr:hypothetical protein [Plantactinospora mayteni]GIG96142.1 hypothetical protein Pma05_27150 [Plantactinospora mayteni]